MIKRTPRKFDGPRTVISIAGEGKRMNNWKWTEQEKERRSKFSWHERRIEDGKMITTTLYRVGGVLFIFAVVIVPWIFGIIEIYEQIMNRWIR